MIEVQFTYERDTMRKVRFTEVGEDDPAAQRVGKLYVSKPVWEEMGKPNDVTIVIKPS